MAQTDTSGERNPVAEFLLGTILTAAKANRADVEKKWNRNRAIRHADPDLDPTGTWKKRERKGKWKSDTFISIGRQKHIAAYSIASDAIFKDGRIPFQVLVNDEGEPTEAMQMDPAMAEFADNQVEWEQARMNRQHRASRAVEEMCAALDDNLTYGECWGHAYVAQEEMQRRVPVAPGVMQTVTESRDMLAFEHVSPWEMYFDMEAGRDHETWAYCVREQQKSSFDIANMAAGGAPFNAAALRRVLESGEGKATPAAGSAENVVSPKLRELPQRLKNVWVREFWALVPTKKLAAFERKWMAETESGANLDGVQSPAADAADGADEPRDWEQARVWAITAGNEIIAYLRDPGPLRYRRVEWEPNNDKQGGVGVADKMEFVTKVINGMVRSYENNAKLLSNLVAAVKREMMVTDPEDALGEEGGLIELSEDCTDARQAIQQVTFQNILAPLIEGIRLFLQFSDDESQLPRAEQGTQGDADETAFALQQRLERSGKYIGNGVRRFDGMIEWYVGQQCDFNQGNPDEKTGKGDFRVIATGFTSFQNQVVRLNKLLQTLNTIVASPELSRMHKLQWLLREIYKAQDIDPDQLLKNPDELAADDQAQQQSEQNQMAIAMLKAQVAAAEAKARKDDASAQQILASIETTKQTVNTSRAKAVVEIEDKIAARNAPKDAVKAGGKGTTNAKGREPTAGG
jgi:hypothetical protein